MIPNPAAELISLLNTLYSNNEFQLKCLKEPYKLTTEEQETINNPPQAPGPAPAGVETVKSGIPHPFEESHGVFPPTTG